MTGNSRNGIFLYHLTNVNIYRSDFNHWLSRSPTLRLAFVKRLLQGKGSMEMLCWSGLLGIHLDKARLDTSRVSLAQAQVCSQVKWRAAS